MNNFATQSPATFSQKREELRSELEATRTAFQELLAQLGESDWNRPTLTTRWTIGEIVGHMTSYLDVVVPMGLANARKGKDIPKMPGFIMNRVNFMMTRSYTRKQSRQSITAAYDKAHARALELLEGVREEDWALTTALPIGKLSIEEIFKHHTRHFQLHREDVLAGLSSHQK